MYIIYLLLSIVIGLFIAWWINNLVVFFKGKWVLVKLLYRTKGFWKAFRYSYTLLLPGMMGLKTLLVASLDKDDKTPLND